MVSHCKELDMTHSGSLSPVYTASVIVTGRCNATCTYCHYYDGRERKRYRYDITDSQFDVYMHFIASMNDAVDGNVNYRFTGGDPMVLGDRIFDLADRGFALTGIRPYTLTAGKKLSEKWVKRASKSA